MRILYVATISNTINAFLIPHIEMLLDQGHHVDIACNIDREISSRLIERGCKVYNIEFERSPLKKENYIAYKKLKSILIRGEYNLVHTHTPVASACVRFACRKIKNLKVFYTVHGFHFYKGAPIKNWLIYYPIEYYLARFTDVLITINKEDYYRAKKFLRATKVEYIPGVGIDTKKLNDVIVDRAAKREELAVPCKSTVLLSVGELNKNKNHETIIKAISKLNNPDIYYLICGQGALENYLNDLIIKLGLEKQIKLLGYRNDVAEICKAVDVFVFPSFREGLSVALMEAMACGLPVICSDIRGNRDLIENEKGGCLIKPNDIDGFVKSIKRIITDKSLYKKNSASNIEKVKKYEIENVLTKLKKTYDI